ncbi:uncharacterized protein G2W53_001703 [Senna tora]|uniref:Uncharacterized protein n=1 Tax=Senna tora TaxID=362788 RepID=A0A834XKA4_9FABA|nr:uncharacterized protein G2W53_001703 [Senna tora]
MPSNDLKDSGQEGGIGHLTMLSNDLKDSGQEVQNKKQRHDVEDSLYSLKLNGLKDSGQEVENKKKQRHVFVSRENCEKGMFGWRENE